MALSKIRFLEGLLKLIAETDDTYIVYVITNWYWCTDVLTHWYWHTLNTLNCCCFLSINRLLLFTFYFSAHTVRAHFLILKCTDSAAAFLQSNYLLITFCLKSKKFTSHIARAASVSTLSNLILTLVGSLPKRLKVLGVPFHIYPGGG